MLFNSEIFVFAFLPLTLIGFFLLGARGWKRAAIAWLVVASAIFYAWFKAEYLLLLSALIIFNYAAGARLAGDWRARRQRPWVLATGILVNIGVLVYYKYANFIVGNANALLGTGWVLHNVVLPLGISFFTFQKIAYLVDAYRGQAEEYNFLDFSLFVMFFPQLIAGPIVHHRELIPQFRQPAIFKVNPTDLAAGLTLFTIGLFKKIVIADKMVEWVVPVFSAANQAWPVTFLEAWGGVLGFTFQIYFDFSAYSDMALGIALMLGIRLPVNFDSPYKAYNIIEFWRSWHMTLSRFLRDYVYVPLGGNRKGKARRYFNLMATMMLGGLWHGAAWTFVAWGALHGVYLIVNHAWHALRRAMGFEGDTVGAAGLWAARAITFLAVVVAWVFFRAESFGGAIVLLKGMAGLNGVALPAVFEAGLGPVGELLRALGLQFDNVKVTYWKGMNQALILGGLLAVVWLLPNSQELLARYRPAIRAVDATRVPAALRRYFKFYFRPSLGVAVAMALVGLVFIQAYRSVTLVNFIYFQF